MVSTIPRTAAGNAVMPRTPLGMPSTVLIAFYLCLITLAGFVLLSAAFLHWFIIPVLACGILVAIDAVDWFRRRVDVFDPIGLLGLLGLYFFFLTPLLHVLWDQWTLFKVTPPQDWRNWLGAMAFLNMLGLLVYRFARWLMSAINEKRETRIRWQLNRQRFFMLISGALMIAGAFQLAVFAHFGGLAAYMEAANNPASWEGLGYTLAIAESFPMLALMACTVFAVDKAFFRSWLSIGTTLLVFAALAILLRGLRGNRSDVIWPLFWGLGILHFWVRPLPRKLIYIGLVLLMMFMYFYQFYDFYGFKGLSKAMDPTARIELAERTGYSVQTVLLGDLGRSDIQAFLLYRLEMADSDYQYAWGRTYLSGFSRLIPRSLLARAESKAKEGTEAQYGWGTYAPVVRESANVYGLAGEAMLNFGPIAVPLAFVVLGIVVGALRHLLLTLGPGDSRKLLLAFLINLCFIILIADLDNVVWFLVKDGGLTIIVLVLSSTFSTTNVSSV